jgi:hypothetical protein
MGHDMSPSAEHVIETFEQAAEENHVCALRRFQVVNLPDQGELWMSGDMHDHRRNYEKLIRAADLGNHRDRHLILHELIHGDRFDSDGSESSWKMLYHAAELKCDYSNQVHFLLANHDLAQIHGEGIIKAGLSVCEAFSAGVRKAFGDQTDKVEFAMKEFFLSLPLAVRAPNGILCCHSLPNDTQIETFDYTVFDRELTGPDYARRTGPVYQLIWGRNVTPGGVALFAEEMQAEIILTGHQPQEDGYSVNGPQHMILASDHNQGVFLPLNLAKRYDMDRLVAKLQRYAAIDA